MLNKSIVKVSFLNSQCKSCEFRVRFAVHSRILGLCLVNADNSRTGTPFNSRDSITGSRSFLLVYSSILVFLKREQFLISYCKIKLVYCSEFEGYILKLSPLLQGNVLFVYSSIHVFLKREQVLAGRSNLFTAVKILKPTHVF